MIFYVSYTLFETPSNYMLKRFRPSRWIAFLMFAWGAMTMILGGINNFGGLVAFRFLLGVFEAGLFPGMIYFLTFWYRPEERALRIALILASATFYYGFGETGNTSPATLFDAYDLLESTLGKGSSRRAHRPIFRLLTQRTTGSGRNALRARPPRLRPVLLHHRHPRGADRLRRVPPLARLRTSPPPFPQ